jgi:hypothetical protein
MPDAEDIEIRRGRALDILVGGLILDPQIMFGFNLVLVTLFGKTHPAPTALTRHILCAQITTDSRTPPKKLRQQELQ